MYELEQDVTVNGRTLEQVKEFQYLGSLVSKTRETEKDVEQRIKKA